MSRMVYRQKTLLAAVAASVLLYFGAAECRAASNTADDYQLYLQSCSLAAAKNHVQAINILDDLIKRHPDFADAFAQRAWSCYKLGRFQDAYRDLSSALTIDGARPQFYILRGITHNQLHQYQLARQDFSRALSYKPDSVFAYSARGYASWKEKDCTDAVDSLTRAIALRKDFPRLYAYRAAVYCDMNQIDKMGTDTLEERRICGGTFIPASLDRLEDMQAALIMNLKSVPLQEESANLYLEIGQYEYAKSRLQAALQLIGSDYRLQQALQVCEKAQQDSNAKIAARVKQRAPATASKKSDARTTAATYGDYGRRYAAAKQFQPALAYISRAVQLDPNNPNWLSARANIYMSTKQYDMALADVNQLIKLNPDDYNAYLTRAKIYELKGDKAKAAADYQIVPSRKPAARP